MTAAIRPVLSLVAALFLAAPDDATKADKEKFQGSWLIESLEEKGEKADAEDLEGLVIRFEGEKYHAINKEGEDIERGTFTIDEGKSPRTIDFQIKRGPDEGKSQLGIYQFRGTTLRICYATAASKERPKEFATNAEGEASLLVLKKKP
jgi:uncharacterized protein (TIGR03067 family)